MAREAGIPLELERVDIMTSPHRTERGVDFATVNPNGYVPALRLDDGSVLTEAAVILQYLADLKPEAGLAPPAGTPERYRLQSWLNFIAIELHKSYSPWLFHAESGAKAQEVAREEIGRRLGFVEHHLAGNGPFLLGEGFGVADVYLFAIAGWSDFARVDLSGFPQLRGFLARVEARPAVWEADRAAVVEFHVASFCISAGPKARLGRQASSEFLWAPRGQRPVARGHHRFEWFHVTAFVSPATGESFWYLSTSVDKALFEV